MGAGPHRAGKDLGHSDVVDSLRESTAVRKARLPSKC